MSGTSQKRTLRLWGPILLAVLALIVMEVFDKGEAPETNKPPLKLSGRDALVEQAFREHISDLDAEVEGTVERVLSNDEEGARHQRFIIRLASEQTLLVAHNIDLAPVVPLKAGDRVLVRGKYEWSEQGGVIHWTHRDPDGYREGGWIEHDGRRYR